MNLPTDIANQSLDAAGLDFTLGDIEEGTRPAQVLLRAYGQCLRQLLRAANWDFARKTAPLVLLGDATGQTANAGTLVPTPWIYEYQYPIDCAKLRFVMWNQSSQAASIPTSNIQSPPTPLMTGLNGGPLVGQRIVPARFTIASDYNYPPQAGQETWVVQGVSPQGRTVVLTNVQNAQCVYTAIMLYPSVWDSLFRAGLVTYLGSEICLTLHKDKKLAIAIQDRLIKATKAKITEARLVDGNEGWYSSDIRVDWMDARASGGPRWNGGGMYGADGGLGVLGYGWDACGFADGSAY